MGPRLAWLVAAVAVLAPQAASAATARVDGYRIVYEAVAGEANDVTLSMISAEDGSATVTFREVGAVLAPGPGCVAISPGEVSCSVEVLYDEAMSVTLADGNDRFSAAGACRDRSSCLRVRGGGGDDVVVGSGGGDELHGEGGADSLEGGADPGCFLLSEFFVYGCDLLLGGHGDDSLSGGAGSDVLVGGPGADVLAGGRGFDQASYARRRQPVALDLDGARDDGSTGERDRIVRDVEMLVAGRARDRLIGNARGNVLDGSAGNDVVAGREGRDYLIGSSGADRLYGGASADELVAGPTDERGHNLLEGRRWRDLLFGGDGNDGFEAADGNGDSLYGGAGRDAAHADRGLDRLRSIESARLVTIPRAAVKHAARLFPPRVLNE
jgi:hypothetical protein